MIIQSYKFIYHSGPKLSVWVSAIFFLEFYKDAKGGGNRVSITFLACTNKKLFLCCQFGERTPLQSVHTYDMQQVAQLLQNNLWTSQQSEMSLDIFLSSLNYLKYV